MTTRCIEKFNNVDADSVQLYLILSIYCVCLLNSLATNFKMNLSSHCSNDQWGECSWKRVIIFQFFSCSNLRFSYTFCSNSMREIKNTMADVLRWYFSPIFRKRLSVYWSVPTWWARMMTEQSKSNLLFWMSSPLHSAHMYFGFGFWLPP